MVDDSHYPVVGSGQKENGMVEQGYHSQVDRYPTLIINSQVNDYWRRPSGGGRPRTFGDIGEAQEKLLQFCDVIKTDLNTNGQKMIGIAQLKLRDNALAKSHRPIETFTDETCPVIGDLDEAGELLVLVSPSRLDQLSEKVRSLGQAGLAHLTSIESFTLVERERRFPLHVRSAILDRLQHSGQARLKVRILSTHILASVFREELYEQKLALTQMGVEKRPYLDQGDFEVYAVQVHNIEEAISLASLSFVDRLELMPVYFSTASFNINTADLQFEENCPLDDLPIVAIVDTGIDPHSPLQPLIFRRETYVPQSEYNPSHGTSVAAIAAALDGQVGKQLIPRCRLLDVAIMPDTRKLDEDKLIDRLEQAVDNYGAIVKHWNLSLAAEPDSQPTTFSGFAKKLDELHKRYGVMFYCAAGNSPDCRNYWPPNDNVKERWVSPPGDTVCGITVGACTDSITQDDAFAPEGAPSPFSPRGPVAYGVIKPDLLDVGGNIARDGTLIGVNSIERDGKLSTFPGTSFATPRVCGASAEIQTCIERSGAGNAKSYLLTKALLLHHAKIPVTSVLGGNIRASDYYGYGIPSPLQDTIGDYFWRSTTLICGQLYPNGEDLVIDDFPYPDGLCSDTHSSGQVWITMVSDPVLNLSFDTEYVRSNVDVHFGTVRNGRFTGQAKCVHTGTGDERSLIREEHKWSSIKQYRSPSPVKYLGSYWRLRMGLTLREKESSLIRAGIRNAQDYPVDIVIAVTIADPQKFVQVNNQVLQKWRMRGYIPAQIEVAPRLRARFATNNNIG